MKNILSAFFLISMLGLFSSQAVAQTFKPGLIAGVTTSQVGGDGYSGFNKLGLTFGGLVRYKVRDNWAIQFELAFVQKGSRNNFSISETDPNQVSEYFLLRLNYIEIPLLARFSFRNFVYEAGFYYAQMVGFHFEYRNDAGQVSGPYESLESFNGAIERAAPPGTSPATLRDYDLGALIGVGYKINDNLLGSIRVSNSIIPIKKHDSGNVDLYPTSLNIGWTNTVLVGSLRYTFGKGDEEVFVDPNKNK